jgi:hypothetical protein
MLLAPIYLKLNELLSSIEADEHQRIDVQRKIDTADALLIQLESDRDEDDLGMISFGFLSEWTDEDSKLLLQECKQAAKNDASIGGDPDKID